MLAIIGGSGFAHMSSLESVRREAVRTPYGEPSGVLTFGSIGGREIAFLARHGYGHTIPPHQINYRANIWALHARGAKSVVAIAAVGGIRGDLAPGDVVVPDQILDYTHGRAATYFDLEGRGVQHIDFTQPYSPALRAVCLKAAGRATEPVVDGGVYAATQGPRLETAAEVNRLERDGADVIGMTGMPEASLAREIGLAYATLAIVVNHAAGRGDSRAAIDMDAMTASVGRAMGRVQRIIEQVVGLHGD